VECCFEVMCLYVGSGFRDCNCFCYHYYYFFVVFCLVLRVYCVVFFPPPPLLLSFFLSFFLGVRRPNLITGLSGWRTPDQPLRTQEPVPDFFSFSFLEFIKCVCGLRWMWGNCSVLCRMYQRGKEVIRE